MSSIDPQHFKQALLMLLDETFDNVHGFYLDGGTSLFETLSEVTAEQASIPVGGRCATLAAQVRHVAFYMDFTVESVNDPNLPPADWGHIWRTVSAVSAEEWQASQSDLRASYNRIRQFVRDWDEWSGPAYLGGAMAVVAHCAYHLGEIRQALCTLRP